MKSRFGNFQTFLKTVCSFETLFVFFLFSYQYKNAYPFSEGSDVTIILLTILLPCSIYLARKEKNYSFRNIENLTLGCACLLIILQLCFHPQPAFYSKSKALSLLVLTLPSYLICYHIIAPDMLRLHRLMKLMITFSTGIAGIAFYIFVRSGYQLTNILGNNYLVTGQTLSTGFLLITVLSYNALQDPRQKYLLAPLVFLWGTYTFLGLNLGGRGPVLGTLIVVIVFYSLHLAQKPQRLWALKHLTVCVLSCSILYGLYKSCLNIDESHFSLRVLSATQGKEIVDQSVLQRIDYYKAALNAFFSHPVWGIGLGHWPAYYAKPTDGPHPHNIILEIAAEMGMTGLVIFMVLLFAWVRPFIKKRWCNSSVLMSTAMLWLYGFLNSLKSGDINDNIFLICMTALLTRQCQKPRPESHLI